MCSVVLVVDCADMWEPGRSVASKIGSVAYLKPTKHLQGSRFRHRVCRELDGDMAKASKSCHATPSRRDKPYANTSQEQLGIA